MDVVVGVDVSKRRGLDIVVLDRRLRVIEALATQQASDLEALLHRRRPGAVAIDSPPGPGSAPGASTRACELALIDVGINIFRTPSDPQRFAGAFYDWIRVGIEAYTAAARAGYPIQIGRDSVSGHALEVFPHATDAFLRGCLPPPGTTRHTRTKREWRLATLHAAGVDTGRLCVNRTGTPTMDSIDAALAALTAHHALEGNFSCYGSQGEWIVVPGNVESRLSRQTSSAAAAAVS